ncbi:MAG TPA: hypothetical protein VIB62_01915 [Actinomycetota bacterium]
MPTRDELDALPTKTLHDLAIETAKRRHDLGFLWRLVKVIPAAEEAAGDEQRAKADIRSTLALINDALYDAGEGALGEALRPMYLEYLEEHGSALDDATGDAEPDAG